MSKQDSRLMQGLGKTVYIGSTLSGVIYKCIWEWIACDSVGELAVVVGMEMQLMGVN